MISTYISPTDIAIIGLAGRFPGARDVREFWRNLCSGVESVISLSDEELSANGVAAELLANPRYIKADAPVNGYDMFDAAFFGYSAREATIMDPQQRLFLECCWEALEDAGFDSDRSDALVGVYAGAGVGGYFFHYLYPQRERAGSFDPFEIGAGNNVSSLAARVSYKLNLKGPSLVVQTACSSSLVAVHLAAQSLLNEECDLALAGGVYLRMPVKTGYLYQIDGLLSPDSHCRPFDADARGTIFGSGVGVVVLKRLRDAVADGDPIRAIIKGSAVNNDGSSKAGFTAPNPKAQAEVVIEALAVADVKPETVTYIEAHGTGTSLGDPIEVNALTRAFGRASGGRKPCGLGSVKGNIGHLDAAAGITGLIKTVLALQHGAIPPSINFRRPNPNIDFANSPFYVNTEMREWALNGIPRRAGVSSFGLGGTNCHVVLEEAPRQTPVGASRKWQLLPLSAKTSTALEAAGDQLARYLIEQSDLELEDVAFTYQTGRRQWPYRRVVIAHNAEEAARNLRTDEDHGLWIDAQQSTQRRLAFLFPDNASQALSAAKALYAEEPLFKQHIEACIKALAKYQDRDVHSYLFSANASETDWSRNSETFRGLYHIQTFAIEYAIAKTLIDWGVAPQAVAGLGVGEYPAACIAGILSVEDALALLVAETHRGSFSDQEFLRLSEAAQQAEFRAPQIPYLSRNSSDWITAQTAPPSAYWSEATNREGRMDSHMRHLIAAGYDFMVAVGPYDNFKAAAQSADLDPQEVILMSAIERDSAQGEGGRQLHEIVGRLWAEGAQIDWDRYSSGIRHKKTSAPTYPFEPKRYWPTPFANADDSFSTELSREDDAPSPVVEEASAPSVTSPEECLTLLFMELLGVEEVAASDRFTELGGDSLLATQLASRIRDRFGVTLPLRSILEQPTVAAISEMIRAAQSNEQAPPPARIPRAKRDGSIPLSYGQQRIWFLDSLDPGNPSHNVSHGVRIGGKVDFAALDLSINEIIRRHEVLRTAFLQERDHLVQAIRPDAETRLAVIDLQGASPDEQEETLLKLAQQEARRCFDLRCPPLLRAALFSLSERDHVLLFTIHHIVSDGWSFGVLVKEMASLYESFGREGLVAALPELPLQYADYTLWQRDLLEGERMETLLSYWRDQLAGPLPLLALPTDHPRPAMRASLGRRQAIHVPAAITDELHRLSRQQGATLFMTLLSAFAVLLKRYTGQPDLLIGTPVANRTDSALESLIGFFVNFLVMRIDASENPAFAHLVSRVRETTLEVYNHQELPFERLVEELQPPRDTSRTPLFEVMFMLQNTPTSAIDVAGVKIKSCEIDPGTATYDLTLSLEETPSGLVGWIEYNMDLFEADSIARMAGHWGVLLQNIASDPNRAIEDLDLLNAAQMQRLLEDWSRSPDQPVSSSGLLQTDEPITPLAAEQRDLCLHELFEAQAEQTPYAVALIFGELELTYEELNKRANRLAHRLRAMGIGVESRVGLCVRRSAEMIIGLLGILKAGGAYVPLDPASPRERLEFLIGDSDMAVLLTEARWLETLPSHDAKIIHLDGDDFTNESEENPFNLTTADNAAYLIYTSGSTGLPKGVIGLHRATVNRLNWMWETIPFEEHEVCCQKTSLSFVDSVWEIFGPLLKGNPSLIVPDEAIIDPGRLIEMLAHHQVTRIVLVPSLLKVMLELFQDMGSKLSSLKYCVTSGEEASTELCRLFIERMPQTTLINLYGSSEVAADVTCCDIGLVTFSERAPIGRPISNARVYILDRRFRPVPVGVPGQILVGGLCLARGYLNRPDLTAEKFIPDPFSPVPGARLYQTGDVGRHRPDGQIEYLGRMDHQVKVRGYRIELGEIETALREEVEVKKAVVTLAEIDKEKQMVAYVVCQPGQRLSTPKLRTRLKQRLPSYMVPSYFMELNEIPLTTSGKVDRTMLPVPEPVRSESGSKQRTGETRLHNEIASIVEEILHLDLIGFDDDFFDLGAHSLLMVKLKSRLDEAFDQNLSMADIFKRPTVNALAELIKKGPKPDFAAELGSSRARFRQELRRRRQQSFQ